MRPWLPVAVAALLVSAGCSPFGGTASASPSPSPAAVPSPSLSPSPTPSPTPTPSPSPSPTPKPTSLYVLIDSADFGDILAETAIGATCSARVIVDGKDVPGVPNPKVADAAGNVRWTYITPPTYTNGQPGETIVTCRLNGLSGTSYQYFPVGT